MADYPFKINITTKDGTKKSFFTASLATNADTVVSSSVMVDRINNMFSASSFIESIEAPSLTSTKYNNASEGIKFLSASVTHPNTGSIIFTDKETDANGGLDHYEFYGTKVCSVLGLPEGVPVYTENFKLSDSSTDTTNYISGEFISDRIALKKGFKMSPQARVQSNLVWDHAFGEGFLQWVSGSNTKMSIGYNNVTDRYTISSPSGSFNLVQSNRFAGKNFVGNYIDPEDASGLEFYVGGALTSLFYSTSTTLNQNAFAAYQFQIVNGSGTTSFAVAPNEDSPLSVAGGAHFSDSSAGELPVIHIENTNGDANGPLILLEKDTNGEADNDVLGNIRWRGHDDDNNATDYARLYVRSTDVSDGTEDGDFHIQLMDNGTLGDKLVIGPTTATFTDDLSVGGDISVSGTVDGIDIAGSLNQAVKTTSSPTFSDLTLTDDLIIADRITHSGDTDTYISFQSNVIDIYTGNTETLELKSTTSTFNGTLGVGADVSTGTLYIKPTSDQRASLAAAANRGLDISSFGSLNSSNPNMTPIVFRSNDADLNSTYRNVAMIHCVTGFHGTNDNQTAMTFRTSDDEPNEGTEHFRIAANGTLTATDTSIGSNSDIRTKTNIVDYIGPTTGSMSGSTSLELIESLNMKHFEYNGDYGSIKGKKRVGVIAQEVTGSVPYIVNATPRQIDERWITENEDGSKTKATPTGSLTEIYDVSLGDLVPDMINAIKDLSQQVKTLRAQISGSG